MRASRYFEDIFCFDNGPWNGKRVERGKSKSSHRRNFMGEIMKLVGIAYPLEIQLP